MAWVGWHDPNTQSRPVAVGDQDGYIRNIRSTVTSDPKTGRPVWRSIGTPQICNDLVNNPIVAVAAEILRVDSSLGRFPIRRANAVCGTLAVYSEEPFFFRTEIALLEEPPPMFLALDNIAGRNTLGMEQKLRAKTGSPTI